MYILIYRYVFEWQRTTANFKIQIHLRCVAACAAGVCVTVLRTTTSKILYNCIKYLLNYHKVCIRYCYCYCFSYL